MNRPPGSPASQPRAASSFSFDRRLSTFALSVASTAAGRHGGIVLLSGARLNAVQGLQGLADLIVVDNTAWLAAPAAQVDIADLALDLRRRSRLEIRYRRSAESQATARVVDPYGLASKSGRWYLVADSHGAGRLFAIERLESYRSLAEPARLRAGQRLGTVWDALKERVEEAGEVTITARLREGQLDRARRILGARIHGIAPPENGWCQLTIRYPEPESVRQLLQFADHIEVLAPPEARERVRELATDLAARHRCKT